MMLVSTELAVTVSVAPVGPTPPDVPAMLEVQVVDTVRACTVVTPPEVDTVAQAGVPEVHVTVPVGAEPPEAVNAIAPSEAMPADASVTVSGVPEEVLMLRVVPIP